MEKFIENVLNRTLCAIKKFPEANAFCIAEKFYTYKEFGDCIAKIRTSTSLLNCGKNVGVVINDDLESYASFFALWLDGRGYVSLHPMQPIERCLEIIEQAEITVVLDSSSESRYKNIDVVSTKEIQKTNVKSSLEPQEVSDDALAYILFTSGSTGKPKGVEISRLNVAVFMDAFAATGLAYDHTDRCLQSFDLTFDVSVQCYLTALTNGACVYTIPHEEIKWCYVFGLLEDHHLTRLSMPPSMVRYLKPYFDQIDIPSVKSCIMTAEASPLDLIEEWSHCIPNADIYDFYGPTEATIYCTYSSFHRDGTTKTLNGMFTIGKPLDGVTALILDEEGREMPMGEKGELCIAGAQLTPGYWRNAEKNAEAFFEKEYKGKKMRFYHTGDLCYIDQDGDLMVSGRLDFQAKIQGYRVEMGEIEHLVRQFMDHKNAVALAFENKMKNTEIALFIEDEESDPEPLLKYLNTKLPHYMIPSVVRYVPKFPLNNNEKTDRIKLKELI
ncbi:MAG: AMP-binding protein [Rikenellaceae bacterium]